MGGDTQFIEPLMNVLGSKQKTLSWTGGLHFKGKGSCNAAEAKAAEMEENLGLLDMQSVYCKYDTWGNGITCPWL